MGAKVNTLRDEIVLNNSKQRYNNKLLTQT